MHVYTLLHGRCADLGPVDRPHKQTPAHRLQFLGCIAAEHTLQLALSPSDHDCAIAGSAAVPRIQLDDSKRECTWCRLGSVSIRKRRITCAHSRRSGPGRKQGLPQRFCTLAKDEGRLWQQRNLQNHNMKYSAWLMETQETPVKPNLSAQLLWHPKRHPKSGHDHQKGFP